MLLKAQVIRQAKKLLSPGKNKLCIYTNYIYSYELPLFWKLSVQKDITDNVMEDFNLKFISLLPPVV